jgi:PRTRC genetic system protein C
MALKTVALPRTFYSSGRKLTDPNPALSIEEVRAHYY